MVALTPSRALRLELLQQFCSKLGDWLRFIALGSFEQTFNERDCMVAGERVIHILPKVLHVVLIGFFIVEIHSVL
jgi:hypothetical protein